MSNTSDFKIEDGVLIEYVGSDGDVVLADGVTIIGKQTFCLCRKLRTIVIPESVANIDDRTFYRSCVWIHTPAGSYAEAYAKKKLRYRFFRIRPRSAYV